MIDSIAKQNPMKRLAEPDDVAPIVAFLASEAGHWVNGQNIRVDGVSSFADVPLTYEANPCFRPLGIRCMIPDSLDDVLLPFG